MGLNGSPRANRQNGTTQIVKFGPFELDCVSGELRKQGVRIRIQAQPLQILRALLERPDTLVTREELRSRLWPGEIFVDFERGLNTAVNRLRASLGDTADNPRYIETVAGSGYRFIGGPAFVRLDEPQPNELQRPAVRGSFRAQYLRAAAALAICMLIGSGLYAILHHNPHDTLRFRQITFRRGQVSNARFAADGRDIIYTAQWENGIRRLYLADSSSPASRDLEFTDLALGAVSSKGELALLRSGGTMNISGGALARASMNGGALTPVDNNVMAVDWAPDGVHLAIARASGGAQQIEFPIGHVVYRTPGWLGNLRVSPSGRSVAFVSHPVRHDDAGSILVADANGAVRTLSDQWASVSGLAWHPNGRELWFTASREGTHRSVWAVNFEGKLRPIGQAPGMLTLRDIAKDGRVLLTIESRRLEMAGKAPGDPAERNFSLMDWSRVQELSRDGSLLLFDESGEGVQTGPAAYVRNTRTGETIRLAEGFAEALSADGRLALLLDGSTRERLFWVPVSGGAEQNLATAGFRYQWVRLFPDGEHLLALGNAPGQPLQMFIQSVKTGQRVPLTKPMMVRNVAIAPDGRRIAALTPEGKLALFEGPSQEPRLLPFDEPLAPLRWSRDGRWLFVQNLRRQTELPAVVMKLAADSGRLVPWKSLIPADPMGVNAVTGVAITDDEQTYVYSYRRVLSDLYVAEGWR
jgi:DNA-binding winged helix-turn-helix (wHTH) protein/Tol biopolymer transport system component